MGMCDDSNRYEELIATGKMSFRPLTDDDYIGLGAKMLIIIDAFLVQHGIKFQVGDHRIGNSMCLKLDDDYLQYLDIYQQGFMWSTDNHHEGVHPSVASAYLISMEAPHITVRVIRDTERGLIRMSLFDGDREEVLEDWAPDHSTCSDEGQ